MTVRAAAALLDDRLTTNGASKTKLMGWGEGGQRAAAVA